VPFKLTMRLVRQSEKDPRSRYWRRALDDGEVPSLVAQARAEGIPV
jgi:hypothetical protein